MPEFRKPELKDKAHMLIEKMQTIRKVMKGNIPLSDIIGFLPGLPDELIEQIKRRGDFKFKQDGSFENTGEKEDVEFEKNNLKIKLIFPRTITGKYYVLNDSFKLTFDKTYSLDIWIMGLWDWYRQKLEKIDVSRETIFIDLEGTMADILIKLN